MLQLDFGQVLRYWSTAWLGPMWSGSILVICAGVSALFPGAIVNVSVWVGVTKLGTLIVPPGHSVASKHEYWMTPSFIAADGTASVTLVASARRVASKFMKRYSRPFLIGPPSDAPKMLRMSFGGVLQEPSLSGVPLFMQFWISPFLTKKSFALV